MEYGHKWESRQQEVTSAECVDERDSQARELDLLVSLKFEERTS